jgi:hypothetical protein
MDQTLRKISVRIWLPALERFNERINSACLRRDAYLGKVLEHELDRLETAGRFARANSESARLFIAARLDALPRKLVTLTLPDPLVQRLDEICTTHRLVRDSFFNRLFFLLAAGHSHLTHLFFDDDAGWLQVVMERTDISATAVDDLLEPIPEFRDPFVAIRAAFDLPEYQGPDPIYVAPITAETFSGIDLSGLNVYLPDHRLPGAASRAAAISFDDLLADSTPLPRVPS